MAHAHGNVSEPGGPPQAQGGTWVGKLEGKDGEKGGRGTPTNRLPKRADHCSLIFMLILPVRKAALFNQLSARRFRAFAFTSKTKVAKILMVKICSARYRLRVKNRQGKVFYRWDSFTIRKRSEASWDKRGFFAREGERGQRIGVTRLALARRSAWTLPHRQTLAFCTS